MPDSTQGYAARLCNQCGKPGNLPTILPRFGDQPTFHIFDCVGCGYIDWVAQRPAGPPDKAAFAIAPGQPAVRRPGAIRPPFPAG
jgi:hypothetical protein